MRLFATPFYLQNLTYVFDSLSMTAAMVLALWAALLGDRSTIPAATALLAALLFYQPAVNVFLCFAAAGVLLRLARRDPERPVRDEPEDPAPDPHAPNRPAGGPQVRPA